MPRPAAWCEHELEQVRAEKQALQAEIERLRTLNDSLQAENDEREAHLRAVLTHVVELRQDRAANNTGTQAMIKHTLGDAPIEREYLEKMNHIAEMLDSYFNGDARGNDRETGFVLLVFPFGEKEGRCNYISNGANREDIVTLFKEQIKRFEGQPDITGHA